MPRVKIDHIVSFSSEDPEYPAASVVGGCAGARGWRCARGAGGAASLVLQLRAPATISALTVGAVGAATLELCGARGEAGGGWQALAPACVLLPPAASRRLPPGPSVAEGARVRSYGTDELTSTERWDRLRVLLTQPYNTHVQFGLSFIHIYSPEPPGVPRPPLAPPLPLALCDEEEFRPGELFAARLHAHSDTAATATSAQIKKATAEALKNIDDSSAKLKRSSLLRAAANTSLEVGARASAGDTAAHDTLHTQRDTDDDTPRVGVQSTSKERRDRSHPPPHEPNKRANTRESRHTSNRGHGTHSDHECGDPSDEGGSAGGGRALHGVVAVLSGYAGARRQQLKAAARAHGALVQPHWGPQCTHLICAFPNTPKLRAAERTAGEGSCVRAVQGEWLEASAAAGRRLPWRWFATRPQDRVQPPDTTTARYHTQRPSQEECDTDDELEAAVGGGAALSTVAAAAADDDDALYGAVTPPPAARPPPPALVVGARTLPAVFGGRTMGARSALPLDGALLRRYVTAYGGHYLQEREVSGGLRPAYWLCDVAPPSPRPHATPGAVGTEVRADWVWRCHAACALLPLPSPTPTHSPSLT